MNGNKQSHFLYFILLINIYFYFPFYDISWFTTITIFKIDFFVILKTKPLNFTSALGLSLVFNFFLV